MKLHSQFLVILATFFFSSLGLSQQSELSGKIIDSENKEVLFDVPVLLLSPADSSTVAVSKTDDNGIFTFDSIIPGSYVLKVSSFGYTDFVKRVELVPGRTEQNITLKSDSELIEQVTIDAVATRVEQKGDTTQYNANAFKTNPDATVEDLVTKMPGITMENGVVKAQGEQITKVLIDGEEFFGDDAAAALKNLPAEIVSKIQVYDQASDQAKFTGVSDGNEAKALNIVTKSGKNQGQFGKIYGGYGYPNDLYLGGLNVNFFKGTRKISVIGMSNNVNQQNFSTEDILGVTGSSASTGGQQGGRGSGGRGGGSGSDYLVAQQNGVSTTHSLGINYTDKWGTKTKLTGSYFFNGSTNDNSQLTNRTYFVTDTAGQLYNENYSSITTNYNHRLNFKFDIALDSMNSLVINPKISYQANDKTKNTTGLTQTTSSDLINQIVNSTTSDNKGINASNSVLWRHKFTKPKRTISVNLSGTYNDRFGNNGQQSVSTYYDEVNGDSISNINQYADNTTDGYSVSSRVSYTEPLGELWSGEFFYNPTYSANDADKRTYNYDLSTGSYSSIDTSLSNVFSNKTIVNETGANFRFNKERTEIQLGASYQNSTLLNDQQFPLERDVQLAFNSIIPNLRYKFNITKNKSLMVSYRGSTRNPTIDQLQNVIDNSNPLSLSSGNPELKQQYNHRVFGRFNITNPEKASNFFVFLSGEMYSNYITNSSLIAANDTVIGDGITLLRGSQFRQPVNLNGSWNTRSAISYGIPITKLKLNMNFNIGGGYSETPGLINSVVNKSQVTNANAGFTVASNISEKVDFTINYSYNYNNVVNTQQSSGNSNYFVQNIGARFNWIIKERLVFNSTYSLNAYSGLSSGYNQLISLWNGGVGYKLLKNKQLEARVSVFDILNNNNSITRNVTETYVEDVQSNVLNRYFMFTLTYNLRNFGTKAPETKGTQEERGPGGRPPY
jgi:hypothetical protein